VAVKQAAHGRRTGPATGAFNIEPRRSNSSPAVPVGEIAARARGVARECDRTPLTVRGAAVVRKIPHVNVSSFKASPGEAVPSSRCESEGLARSRFSSPVSGEVSVRHGVRPPSGRASDHTHHLQYSADHALR